MAGMIFGTAPALHEVLGRVAELEARINQAGTKSAAASRVRTGAQEHDHTGRQLSKIGRAPAGARHSR